MPRKPNAKVLARMDCPSPGCEETVAVLQTTTGYLYTRCPVCLADQRRGPGVQAHTWLHMEPLPGAEIVRPPNLPDYCGDIGERKDRAEPIGKPETLETLGTEGLAPKAPEPAETLGAQGTDTLGTDSKKTAPAGGGGLWILAGIVGATIAAVASATN